jgi:hypothetical protein
MADTFFFWSPADRKPGHVFAAGNHGKVIRGYRHLTEDATNGWKIAIEMSLENYRLRHAPQKPGRLESAFAFLSEADARSRHVFDPSSRLYEVEWVDPTAASHIADFDLYQTHCKSEPHLSFLPKAELIAKEYWDGAGTGVREIFSLSDMRVVKRIV